jgi:acetylornithine deacetylase/succinyl-diaminopimelate desuccinylase-like protein
MSATNSLTAVLDHLGRHAADYRAELFDLLRIPSISAQPDHRADVRRAAEWVRDRFIRAGLRADIVETAGHPAVLAEGPQRAGRPTVLFYGHHDVQPSGDLSLWHTGPFEPIERDGMIIARGAADDKGQMLCAVYAAEAWLKAAGDIPVNLKFLIEGEEEIGSPNLAPLVESQRERLACDCILIHDTSQFAEGVPAVTVGTRGLVYMEVMITGPKKDLHSGVYGGQVANPANVLSQFVASLHTADGRVNLPGFYDRVAPPSADEARAVAALPYTTRMLLDATGSPAESGEEGQPTLHRAWFRPTLDVNGIYGGYMGEGSSTIIPSRAGAKISMRLVPNQNAAEIERAFVETVKQRIPRTVTFEIKSHAHCDPYVADVTSPAFRAGVEAVGVGFGKRPVLIRSGGTLPILPMFKQVLRADSIMLGYCLPTCQAHSPNEFFHIRDFDAGVRTTAAFFERLGAAN